MIRVLRVSAQFTVQSAGLPLTFKFWKSRLPGCQFWKSRKKNLEVWYFEGWQMDDRTMYMCMEIIALINLLPGINRPPLHPPKKKIKMIHLLLPDWTTVQCTCVWKCMEIIALINLLRGKNSPTPPPKKKKKKNDTPAPSGHHKCLDTLFFLKRHLFNVSYISGHVPYRVVLLSVNVRTPKTCPLFLIKLLFFTSGIFCIFALFTCFSG